MIPNTVYLAGHLSGIDADAAIKRFERRKLSLEAYGYTVLSPLCAKSYLKGTGQLKAGGYANPVSQDSAIFRRDNWMVHQADIIYVDLGAATTISIGTCFELAWASQAGKHVVVSGLSDDHDMNHAFVREAATVVFDHGSEAENYLHKVALDLGLHRRG